MKQKKNEEAEGTHQWRHDGASIHPLHGEMIEEGLPLVENTTDLFTLSSWRSVAICSNFLAKLYNKNKIFTKDNLEMARKGDKLTDREKQCISLIDCRIGGKLLGRPRLAPRGGIRVKSCSECNCGYQERPGRERDPRKIARIKTFPLRLDEAAFIAKGKENAKQLKKLVKRGEYLESVPKDPNIDVEKIVLTHLCGNVGCCNPDHLFLEPHPVSQSRSACHSRCA